MHIQEALEDYLLDQMMTLCTKGKAPSDVVVERSRPIDELGLFDMGVRFERVAGSLGPGTVGPPRVVEDAPESLRVSIEHRYSLSRWPAFEFIIFESKDGLAWGQTFARRVGMPVPVIRGVTDLARWSHVESEVRAALGAPISHEGWSPWESSIYRIGGTQFALCSVYGLLQSVEPLVE